MSSGYSILLKKGGRTLPDFMILCLEYPFINSLPRLFPERRNSIFTAAVAFIYRLAVSERSRLIFPEPEFSPAAVPACGAFQKMFFRIDVAKPFIIGIILFFCFPAADCFQLLRTDCFLLLQFRGYPPSLYANTDDSLLLVIERNADSPQRKRGTGFFSGKRKDMRRISLLLFSLRGSDR